MTARRPVTMKDVADHANVSKMTVSAVLGRSESVRVSPATRERVLRAAQELEYNPNALARSLRLRCTNIFGMYCGYGYLDVRLPFLAEVIGGLQEGCDLHHKDLLLHGVFRERAGEPVFPELVDGRIDGLVLHSPPDHPLVAQLAASSLPVVAVADGVPALPSVLVDDAGGTRMVVRHLARAGHRRVLYVGSERLRSSAVRRQETFLTEAARLGMGASLLNAPDDPLVAAPLLVAALRGQEAHKPTAVACWNDQLAYQVVAQCQRHGWRVPEDVAVVGFDGTASPHAAVCPLTTVRAPWSEVARTAVGLLADRLQGRTVPQETVLPVCFVPGNTA